MFKNKFEMGRLFSPENEGGAGGSGGDGGQAGGDNSSNSGAANELDTLKAEVESLRKAKEQILAEKKAADEKVKELTKKSAQEEKDKAKKEGDSKKLYELELEANKELMAKLEMIESAQRSEKEKILKTQMYNAFLKEIGSELHDPELAFSLVDSSKFIEDKNGKYGFNEKGLKSLADEFRSKYAWQIKSDTKKNPGNAASSTADDISKMSFAERAKKAGLANF